MIGVGSDLEE